MQTVFLAKWDYYGNLQWVVDTESSGTGQYADIKRPGGTMICIQQWIWISQQEMLR